MRELLGWDGGGGLPHMFGQVIKNEFVETTLDFCFPLETKGRGMFLFLNKKIKNAGKLVLITGL